MISICLICFATWCLVGIFIGKFKFFHHQKWIVDEMEKFVISVNGFFLVGIIGGGLRADKLKQGGEKKGPQILMQCEDM